MTAPRRPRRVADEPKRDATRRKLVETSLALFRDRGVEATTMRDIARAAGLSLGAAYYYFPSKDSIVFAFYDANQAAFEADAERAHGSVRERLGALLHGKLHAIRDHRKLLGAIVPRLVDPGDPLSAFSSQTRAVRDRAIAVFARTLADSGVPDDRVPLVAGALWLFHLAVMLVFVHDTSRGQRKSHGLIDDALDLIVMMLPLLATPVGHAAGERVVAALGRAGIALTADRDAGQG